MLPTLQSLAIVLVAIAMALALAHALELPGKMRLPKEQYLAIQQIYYPGFTIGGAAEPLALLVTLSLVFLTPCGKLGVLAGVGSIRGAIGDACVLLDFDAPCE